MSGADVLFLRTKRPQLSGFLWRYLVGRQWYRIYQRLPSCFKKCLLLERLVDGHLDCLMGTALNKRAVAR